MPFERDQMRTDGVTIRHRFERGAVWTEGHLARFARASTELAQTMPWAVPNVPFGTSAGMADGALDLPTLGPGPEVRLRAIEFDGKPLVERRYDSEGRLARVDYANQVSVRYDWNDLGRITSIRAGADKSTRWTYRDDGIVTSVSYPDGARFVYEHADDGRPLRRVYPDGWTISFSYNHAGRLVQSSSAAATFEYPSTDSDHVSWRVNAAETSHEMPDHGTQVDLPCSSMEATDTGRQYTASALGLWVHDSGQLQEMVLPDGERLSVHVDAGQLLVRSSQGQILHHRDVAGNWAGMTRQDGTRLTAHRLADGRSMLVVGPDSASLWNLDDSGRVVRRRQDDGGYAVLRRDGRGRVRRIEHPEGWIRFRYGRTALFRSLDSSIGIRAQISYETTGLPGHLCIASARHQLGIAGLFLTAYMWHTAAEGRLGAPGPF